MKRFIAATLSAVIALSCIIVAVSAEGGYKLGDADRSGVVNIKDATAVQKHIASIALFDDEQKLLADTSGDGNISVQDASLICRFIAFIITEFPGEKASTAPSTSSVPNSSTVAGTTTVPVSSSTVEASTAIASSSAAQTDPTDPTEPVSEYFENGLFVDYAVFENKTHSSEEQLYLDLFDSSSVIDIKVDISEAELKKLQQDFKSYYKSPIYRICNVTITVNGKQYKYDEVGIRMKGNTSRTDIYERNSLSNLVHFKLSFQETFDEEYYGNEAKVWTDAAARTARKDRTFATLEKIDVRWNSCLDKTYSREIYAFDMFRDFGLLAPRVNLSTFSLHGVDEGLFFIYEPVDKIMLKKYLPSADAKGDLFKCQWTNNGATYQPGTTWGIEDELTSTFYNYDLKTNKKTSDFSSISDFIDVMNSNIDADTFADNVDIRSFAYFAACSYFAGGPDDYRNNYNNHYIYFLPTSGKAVYIPTDYDRCFGVTSSWNPTGDGMVSSDPFSNQALGGGGRQKNPVISKSIVSGGMFVNEYKTALADVAARKWLSYEHFTENYYNAADSRYSGETALSQSFGNADSGSLTMSLTGGRNVSVKDYMSGILASYRKALGGGGTNPTDPTEPTKPIYGNTKTYNLTVKVTLPEGTPMTDTLYLASTLPDCGWEADTPKYKLTRTSETTAEITFTIDMRENSTALFKVTRGNWTNHERGADGMTFEGHLYTFTENLTDTFEFTVAMWKPDSGR